MALRSSEDEPARFVDFRGLVFLNFLFFERSGGSGRRAANKKRALSPNGAETTTNDETRGKAEADGGRRGYTSPFRRFQLSSLV